MQDRSASRSINDEAPPTKFVTAAQLRARWGGCSSMFIVRRMADPAFPRPIQLGNSKIRLWQLSEIEAYERSCVRKANESKSTA
jgi:predicted DNA-binding transcriptional regulator AlpA